MSNLQKCYFFISLTDDSLKEQYFFDVARESERENKYCTASS